MRYGDWDPSTHLHRCRTPDRREIRDWQAGNGSVWVCGTCNDRWKLVINVGRASWLNLRTQDKVYVGRI